uniref:Protein phosphatase inhibitor 2 n=1 Tax=Amphora coffeiformis TaxID=265554 RepID=A0A7S3L154_9STRA|mmetsp:Transcript_18174/g.34716  ORF Transcript_18174/g.34716 Transcript_18174/m.34716 type:complete len:196 (-) Transcript_18174:162-749(-)|eukprot:scaffold5198_cov173-Amphora_coffeaeformis.AAC.8
MEPETLTHPPDQPAAASTNSGSNTPSRAAKPALKKGDVHHHHHQQQQQQHGSSADKKHLKWDEKAIEEHDLLRGTRMKIDEPDTPYTHYDSGGESDSSRPKSPANQRPTLQWDVLQNKLDAVSAVQEAYPNSPIAGSNNPEVEEERKMEMHKMEFQEHRKRHYNEMEAVRRFRQEHGGDIVQDDDDDGDADNEAD